MKALLNAIRTKCPGQTECDDAIDILNDSINQLDQAMLATLTGGLQPNASSSLQVRGREGEREGGREGGEEGEREGGREGGKTEIAKLSYTCTYMWNFSVENFHLKISTKSVL